jgi:hypothetical protein
MIYSWGSQIFRNCTSRIWHISLEKAAKRFLGTAHHSKVLKAFLEKEVRREDAFLYVSITIHEFRRISIKFKNSLLYLGKRRKEQKTYVENLKYLRNKIAHSN